MVSHRKRKLCTIQPPLHWRSSAPGSLMLFGEHAVLQGYPAIACAIDHWLTIDWHITEDHADTLVILSALAEHRTSWSELSDHPKLSFMMAGLRWLKQHLADYPKIRLPALTLTVTSQINSTQGLGSSSAVLAALLVGMSPLLPFPFSTQAWFLTGRQIIQHVQGAGSGTDLAVALTGGILQLLPSTGTLQRLADDLPLLSIYVGYKTPTAEVIRYVHRYWQGLEDLYQHQLMSISQLTHLAANAIQVGDWHRLGRLMSLAHGLQQGLGVSDQNLDRLIHQLMQTEGIYGAKISGSGLGDCVIALGATSIPFEQQIPIKITAQSAYWSLVPPISSLTTQSPIAH